MHTADFLCGWSVWEARDLCLGIIEKWHEDQGYILYYEWWEDAVVYFKSNVRPMMLENILWGDW